VLFWLSWRLAPACSVVIVVTALAAGHYRKRTRPVEQAQGRALQRMGAVAHQAFENMRTVRSFAGEALERERFQSQAAASYAAGREFGHAKANFEATNRAAIHASLLMLYSWGGYLVSQGLMPISVLISGIGFTFSLMYATQGAANTLSDLRRAVGAFERVSGGTLVGAGRAALAGRLAGRRVARQPCRWDAPRAARSKPGRLKQAPRPGRPQPPRPHPPPKGARPHPDL
jgi:ATP-binding cassette subfamily B (MDR/TAP) protein 8